MTNIYDFNTIAISYENATIVAFTDGCCYEGLQVQFIPSSEYTGVATVGNVIMKVPSPKTVALYEAFLKGDEPMVDPIRLPEGLERGSEFPSALDEYPEFRACITGYSKLGIPINDEIASAYAYFLVLQKWGQVCS